MTQYERWMAEDVRGKKEEVIKKIKDTSQTK